MGLRFHAAGCAVHTEWNARDCACGQDWVPVHPGPADGKAAVPGDREARADDAQLAASVADAAGVIGRVADAALSIVGPFGVYGGAHVDGSTGDSLCDPARN